MICVGCVTGPAVQDWLLPEHLCGFHTLFCDFLAIIELEVKVALRLVGLVERIERLDNLVPDRMARVASFGRAVNLHGEVASGILVLILGDQIGSPVVCS